MNSNFISILGHLSQSLLPVQSLIAGLGYMVGILFIIKAISKLKKIGGAKVGSSQEKMFGPIAYLLGGIALIYLPSTLSVLSSSAFGDGNILRYSDYNPYDVNNFMGVVIQTAGLIWFFRGCTLLSHASEPGEKNGAKGLIFIIAGLLAINFNHTTAMVNSALNYLMTLTVPGSSQSGP